MLDEADRMMDMGFWPDVRRIITALPADAPDAALLGDDARAKWCDDALEITREAEVTCRSASAARRPRASPIGSKRWPSRRQRSSWLIEHLRRPEGPGADLLADEDRRRPSGAASSPSAGVRCTALHADRSHGSAAQRGRRVQGRQIQVLVATDIAARGLDIDAIHTVINYEVPGFAGRVCPPRRAHRSRRRGRSGHHARRARKSGARWRISPKSVGASFRMKSPMSDPVHRSAAVPDTSQSLPASGDSPAVSPAVAQLQVVPLAPSAGRRTGMLRPSRRAADGGHDRLRSRGLVSRLHVLQAPPDPEEAQPGRLPLLGSSQS